MDGVSPTYLQCDSWSQTYMPMLCPIGTVCFSNPNRPGTAMCGMPGSGGIPDQGTCSGNTAKCKDPGSTGDYYQCDRWSSQYVNATCPPGLKCHNNTISTGVYCE
ncbi:hypothetical protein GQ54DRAFT_308871 [Martensiomyces pterosporus]|nr:hypothetical protein GQ54DRAFT_308871 [Martensiomyces pterosporus]